MKYMNAQIRKLHRIYWAFKKKFVNDDGTFVYQGYDFSRKVVKFAKKYPEITITSCDDSMHMSSDLVLIPHENDKEYCGTTVVYIPQAGEPAELFLYKHHTNDLVEVLSKIAKKFK